MRARIQRKDFQDQPGYGTENFTFKKSKELLDKTRRQKKTEEMQKGSNPEPAEESRKGKGTDFAERNKDHH